MSEKDFSLSRRKFMAVSSAAIAAPILMNMAGTVPDARGEEKTYNFIDRKECDFVVAGSGSGMVAAVRAALAGYKVIILEKTKVIGGGMLFASTMRTFGSKWQKERNLPDVTAKYARKMLDDCYWRPEPLLVSNILKGTGEFFDWFCEYAKVPGDTFKVGRYVFDDEEGPLGPQYGGQHNGFGRMVVETLQKKCPELGIKILTEHKVVDCECKGGKITALIAETKNGFVRVGCRACLLATGSWVNNRKITEKIHPGFFDIDMGTSSHTNPAYTGDGLPIAEKVGAFIDYDSFCLRLMGPMFIVSNRTYSGMAVSPYTISVNLLGKRYASEPLIGHMDQFNGGHVVGAQPKGKVFAIFSENIMKSAMVLGDGGLVIADQVLRGQKLPGTIEECHSDIKEALATLKNCFRADTPEELAGILGIDRKGLLETIAEYNQYCKEGFDWGFYKEKSTLIPFTEGPYYAVSGFMATDGAFGGVKVNPDMQAYKADRKSLVEGLYVTGDFASGRHISLGGVKRQFINDMNWSLAGSYIAGDRVARYLATL
jgi:fumarate reductase flavoprotein subunit